MRVFKYLKYFSLFGFGTTLISFLGISVFQNSSSSQKLSQTPNVISNQEKLVNQAVGKQGQSLGSIRRFQNNNFTGIPVKNTIEGSLVLTGDSSITRTDFFGNVLWTFDPSVASDIFAAKSDSKGNLISNGDGTPVSSGQNFVSDLANKMVIEATQDQSNPNLFYLLLIPKDWKTVHHTYTEVNANPQYQGTIVAISENFDLANQPYGIVGIQNVKPEDMVKNYPSSWRSTATTGPTFFTKGNHASYFDASDMGSTAISMPWDIYITNLSNIYGNDGTLYIAGGNGTIFSGEDVLSIGMFRVSFDFATEKSSSIGWPYALLFSNIGIVLTSTTGSSVTTTTTVSNLPMGQDSNFQYVPRMAVAGLVSAQDNGETTINKISLIGTITLGTKTDHGAPSDAVTKAITDSAIGDNAVNLNQVTTAAVGNSYSVQTLFEAYLSLKSLNSLSGFNNTNAINFTGVLYSPSSISVGVPYAPFSNSAGGSSGGSKTFIEQYLYSLTKVGTFSPRNVGNVVTFVNSQDSNYRSYYFQLGGYLVKMYLPAFEQQQFTNTRLSIFQDTATSNKAFATLTSDTGAQNNWSDFKGTFMIGGDNNPNATDTIIGSAWSRGIYFNKFQGANSHPQVSAISNGWAGTNIGPVSSITQTNYSDPQGTTPTTANATNPGVLGYRIDPLDSVSIPSGTMINGAVSSVGTNQAYVQTNDSNSYSAVTYSNSSSLQLSAPYTSDSKASNLGSGSFKTAATIDQSFFTNTINDVVVDSGSTKILDPRYRSLVFDYNRPEDISNNDWRIVVLSSNINDNVLTLSAQVKNPLTGEYTPIPNTQNQSTILNSATFSGFNALPAYVIPVAVAVPIVIVALIVGLSLGIGIPMHKNKQALKQGFDISNKKVDTLTTAVGSVFKQIINKTQIGNIKKSPQMLKSAAAKKTPPEIKKSAATAPKAPGASPVKPTASPIKPKSPVKAPSKDVK